MAKTASGPATTEVHQQPNGDGSESPRQQLLAPSPSSIFESSNGTTHKRIKKSNVVIEMARSFTNADPPSTNAQPFTEHTTHRRRWFGGRCCIATRLAIFVSCLTLVSVGTLAIISWINSYNLVTDILRRRMLILVSLKQQHISSYLEAQHAIVELVSSRASILTRLRRVPVNGTLTDVDLDAGNSDLKTAMSSIPHVIAAAFYSLQGVTILDFGPGTTVTTFGDYPCPFNSTLSCNDPVQDAAITDPILHPEFGLTYSVTEQVKNRTSGADLGFLRVLFNATELQYLSTFTTSALATTASLIVARITSPTTFRFMLPPKGKVEYFGQDFPLSIYPVLSNANGLDGEEAVYGTSFDGTGNIMAGYAHVNAGTQTWILIAQISLSEIAKPILNVRNFLLIGVFSTIVATFVISYPFSRIIVRPISLLAKTANALSAGDMDARVAVEKNARFSDEITDLKVAFNGMADQLCEHYMQLETKVQERTRESEAARAQADLANAAKSSFLATITHELRTPLNGVIGLSGILAETSLDADQKDLISSIRECSDGLLIIINDVLDFSKIEAGKLHLEHRPFDLSQCIEHALYPLNLRASQKGLTLSHHIGKGTPTIVKGDVTRVKQILINLVGISVKFTENGSVTVRVEGSEKPNGTIDLAFQVQDTGIGIKRDAMNRLFQLFSQVDSSTTRKYGGTGLGLAICRQLVDMMGGKIWVESEPGIGSTFHFTIKVAKCSEADHETRKVKPAAPVLKNIGEKFPLKILVAEDNAVNQKLAIRILSRIGYTATVVGNGMEAVNAVRDADSPFDIILMDMQMPVMSGIEATLAIRSMPLKGKQPVIIALTANAMETDRQRCIDAGMDGHVSKPVKAEILAETLEFWGARVACRHAAEQKVGTSTTLLSDVPELSAGSIALKEGGVAGLKWGTMASEEGVDRETYSGDEFNV
ncbi:hypothetical protein HK104_009529 [Borealophlyctis nickersoniae]|nr:hypothetical protein HK104_009529 [Borealophlyctis nickersoniae]